MKKIKSLTIDAIECELRRIESRLNWIVIGAVATKISATDSLPLYYPTFLMCRLDIDPYGSVSYCNDFNIERFKNLMKEYYIYEICV